MIKQANKFTQGDLLEVEIADLSSTGEGIARIDGYVIFVPDTVTGDRALVRLTRVKSQYAQAKLEKLNNPSPYRHRPRCIVADKCGGCQWQHITDEYQQVAKQAQVIQTLKRVGGFSEVKLEPLIKSGSSLGYRNKVTYPLGVSATGMVQTGYYRRGTHQLVNLNQCPIQDSRLNPLLAEIKHDIQNNGWSIYNENNHQGKLRHLSLRVGRRTGEILLTLISADWHLPGLEQQASIWLKRYPELVGVGLNYNPQHTNVIFGSKTKTIAGLPYLREIFADLEYRLCADTFFQVNTETAEALLGIILDKLAFKGDELLIDAYCGIGTFTLPLAKQVKQAIGIEVYPTSVEQAKINAEINGISNVTFVSGSVENLLKEYLPLAPDVVILDPPRQGCDPSCIKTLLEAKPPRLVYISCQPATLARDLKLLCQDGTYELTVIPADFFPQTAHIECAAFLQV